MTIVSVCLSPGFQRSVVVDSLALGEVNRLKSVDVDVSGKGVNVTRVLQRLSVAACCLSQGGSNADELVALDAVSRLPAEYPGWMFERQGEFRRQQLQEGRGSA